jgi:hypothetical protein
MISNGGVYKNLPRVAIVESGYALCSSRRVINAEIKSHDHEGHEEHEGENNRKHLITYRL